MDSLALPPVDEQERILTESRNSIKRSAYQMRKAMEEDNMRDALRYSAAMLGELRTSSLAPQKYYELYMQVFDQLVNLEMFFGDERSKGRSFSELYELVQHAGNVLPRLYLMVAVGCLYIKSGEALTKEILKDLVEMCKGVQHPTRGLFLRSFLCQRSRGLMPDTGSDYEGPGGDIHDALDFLLSNFVEMNKLWVRMQHQGSTRDREKREKERVQLQDLVGKNLTYISQLDGLDFNLYKTVVLPRVLEQIISCKDDIGQQYLMQCIIQGFPDAFHLGTLQQLLAAFPQLQPGVKVHAIMSSLMDRLTRYASSNAGVTAQLLEMQAFERLRAAIASILSAQPDMPPADAIEMYVALMNYTGSVHPTAINNVNQVLSAAHQALHTRGLSGDNRAEKQLVALLTIPLAKYDVVTGLGLSEYPLLMSLLRNRTHKDLAVRIIQTVVDAGTRIGNLARVDMLFRFIRPLVQDPAEGPADSLDEEDTAEEQGLVSRLLHTLRSDDNGEQFDILGAARGHLLVGGAARYRHSLPALVFCTLALVRRMTTGADAGPAAAAAAPGAAAAAAPADALADAAAELKVCDAAAAEGEAAEGDAAPVDAAGADEPAADSAAASPVAPTEVPPAAVLALQPEAVLQWLLETCQMLVECNPLMALRTMLATAHAASEEAKLEMLAYEFFEQAFTLYEEAVADSRMRVVALQAIIGTLHSCYVFGPENRDALVQNATGYSAKLLKRSDQCKAVCACSHLAWQADLPAAAAGRATVRRAAGSSSGDGSGNPAPVRDAAKVMACLKRALKVANSAKQQVAATGGVPRGGKDTAGSGGSYVALYIEIFNHYLYYFDKGVEGFTPGALQQMVELIQGELQSAPPRPPAPVSSGGGSAAVTAAAAAAAEAVDPAAQWANTRRHIEEQKRKGGDAGSRYIALQV